MALKCCQIFIVVGMPLIRDKVDLLWFNGAGLCYI